MAMWSPDSYDSLTGVAYGNHGWECGYPFYFGESPVKGLAESGSLIDGVGVAGTYVYLPRNGTVSLTVQYRGL